MTSLIRTFLADESGATSIEYGLIAAGIGVALITLVGNIGTELQNLFRGLSENMHSFNTDAHQ